MKNNKENPHQLSLRIWEWFCHFHNESPFYVFAAFGTCFILPLLVAAHYFGNDADKMFFCIIGLALGNFIAAIGVRYLCKKISHRIGFLRRRYFHHHGIH